MAIETLDDIIEEIANLLGVYGAHPEEGECNSTCRICLTSDLELRIRAAMEIEERLGRR